MNHLKGKRSNQVNETKNQVNDVTEKLNLIRITGTLAIIATLIGIGIKSADGQTLVTKKQYDKVLEEARKSQELIGEDMASFIYGGGIESFLQQEIEKQTSLLSEGTDEFSLFDKENIENRNRDTILNKEEMEKKLRYKVDSIVAEDVAKYYEAFHNYQESAKNLVGKKKGKGTYIHSGWTYAPFPTDLNVDDVLENNKNIPYTNKEQEVKKASFEKIYENELSKRKKEAEANRKTLIPAEYKQADLIALEGARKNIANQIWKSEVQPIVDRMFKEYYSRSEDAVVKKGGKNKNR